MWVDLRTQTPFVRHQRCRPGGLRAGPKRLPDTTDVAARCQCIRASADGLTSMVARIWFFCWHVFSWRCLLKWRTPLIGNQPSWHFCICMLHMETFQVPSFSFYVGLGQNHQKCFNFGSLRCLRLPDTACDALLASTLENASDQKMVLQW